MVSIMYIINMNMLQLQGYNDSIITFSEVVINMKVTKTH